VQRTNNSKNVNRIIACLSVEIIRQFDRQTDSLEYAQCPLLRLARE